MSFEETNIRELISKFHLGILSREEFSILEAELLANEAARDYFRHSCRVDTLLRGKAKRKNGRAKIWITAISTAAAAAVLILLAVALYPKPQVAELVSVSDAVWKSGKRKVGDTFQQGAGLELASGTVSIRFQSDAVTHFTGPGKFRIDSANSGRLYEGSAQSIAESETAAGFTIHMPTVSVIDQGTVFTTRIDAKKNNVVSVDKGKVEVTVDEHRHSLLPGTTLSIAPGSKPMLIQVEAGDETPEFKFANIPPPSDSDYADLRQGNATLSTDSGKRSGAPTIEALIDGKGQSHGDEPVESVVFGGNLNGSVIFDLGKAVPVSRIVTYSWHQSDWDGKLHTRSNQNYTVWGFEGDRRPVFSDNPARDGWKKITSIHTDDSLGTGSSTDRPPQIACSIESFTGTIGSYRFLYFDLAATGLEAEDGNAQKNLSHTMYGEIDIYVNESGR